MKQCELYSILTFNPSVFYDIMPNISNVISSIFNVIPNISTPSICFF